MRLVAISTALCLVAFGPVFAQSGNNGGRPDQGNAGQNANQNTNANANSAAALPAQVTNELQQAGFTDVQIVPRSFLVRAKDKDGQPVMMLVNENSIMAITGYPDQGGETTGSGAGSRSPSGPEPGASPGNGSSQTPGSHQ